MFIGLLALLALAMYVISALLYGVEVFIKRRALVWQGTALILTLVGIGIFSAVYGASVPAVFTGHEPRAVVTYWPELVFVTLALAVRLAIYVALFVVPAVTLSDEEYLSDAAIEERANDQTAVFLAYLPFAGSLSAWLAFSFNQPPWLRVAQMGVILAVYFLTSFLQDLRKMIITLAVELQLAFASILNGFYVGVLKLVEGIVWLERLRRREVDENLFLLRLERQIHDAQIRNGHRQAAARERLRGRTLN